MHGILTRPLATVRPGYTNNLGPTARDVEGKNDMPCFKIRGAALTLIFGRMAANYNGRDSERGYVQWCGSSGNPPNGTFTGSTKKFTKRASSKTITFNTASGRLPVAPRTAWSIVHSGQLSSSNHHACQN